MQSGKRVSSSYVAAALGLAGLCGLALSTPAHAGDARCAMYGPDFVAVEGTSTCIRIGGRVRVEAGTHLTTSPNAGWGNDSVRPAGMRSDTAPSDVADGFARRLRLPEGLAAQDFLDR